MRGVTAAENCVSEKSVNCLGFGSTIQDARMNVQLIAVI
jgi:hypothetical protein